MSNDPESIFPWAVHVEAAKRETDLEKVRLYVQAAEEAIFVRGLELAQGRDTGNERRAMAIAFRTLQEIQIRKLNYPPWP